MARKKTDAQPEAPADAAAPPPPADAQQNGDVRRPAQSWAVNSDRTTRVEVACWTQTYVNARNESYEQVTFTLTRSYRTEQNGWQKGGSWRAHDIPIVLFLLSKAHAWALDRRTDDSSIPL